MKNTTLTFILISLLSCNKKYDNIKDYTIENTNSIVDYQSLEVISKSIGDSRIVLLGEQDHGDAPSFLAKTEIIKYLHDKKEFNIIVFESDFYGLYKLNENKRRPSREELTDNLYSVWSNCSEFSSLLDFIDNHTTVKTYGMDCRLRLKYSKDNFTKELLELNLTINNAERFYQIVRNVISLEYEDRPSSEDKQYFFEEIDRAITGQIQESFAKQSLLNLKEFANNAWNGNAVIDIRDRQMASNLLWISKTFPNQKIIVWAHNLHISKNVQLTYNTTQEILKGSKVTMGTELSNQLREDEYYILGFSSLQGQWGNVNMIEKLAVDESKPDGFENWIGNQGIDRAFVDFKGLKGQKIKSDKFEMKGYFHSPSNYLPWGEIFDGVYFVRDMYPCTKVR